MSEAAAAALAAYRRGEISAEIAVMRAMLASGDREAVLAWSRAAGEPDLLRVAAAHPDGLAGLAALVAAGLTDERTGSIDAIREQFDAAVALAPEAAVALYSLGSAATLERATSEIVERLRDWRLAGPDAAVLDIGCGIGRVARALAPHVARVTGIDVSPAMIAEARRRCRGLRNVEFACVDGRDLASLAGRRFGLVLAVDVFPYLVAAGPDIAAGHVADAAGLLEPGGGLVILNFSYRGDLELDRADVARLACTQGLVVERNGTRDFSIWDGAAFVLRRPG